MVLRRLVVLAALCAACSDELRVEADAGLDLGGADVAPDVEIAPDAAPDAPEDAAPDLPDEEDSAADLALPPLPPRSGVVERVLIDPAYPLPDAHELTCRIALRGPGPAELVWRRNGAEIGRGPRVSATLALGDEVTCEVVINGAVAAQRTVRASRMGQLADLDRAPARPVIRDERQLLDRLPEHGEQISWVGDYELWRSDGSSERTEVIAGRNGFNSFGALMGERFVVQHLNWYGELLLRLDDPSGPPALDLRAAGPRVIKDVASTPDAAYALMTALSERGINAGHEVWRVATAAAAPALLWSTQTQHLTATMYPHAGGVTLATDAQIIRLDEVGGQTVLFEGEVRLPRPGPGQRRCVLTRDAEGAWSMQRVEAGQLVMIAPLTSRSGREPAEAGDGCAVVDGDALVVGRGGEVTRYPLPAPDVHLSPLDGEPSLLNARRGDRWNVQGAGFVRATQPWTMSAALYTTEARRHLARANDDGAVYASDGAGGWRRIWTDLSRMAIPLGVVNDRALFDVTGALYAARRDGRGAGQLEPWVTEGFWPEAAHTQGDARTQGVVAGQQRRIWHIDGKRAQELPGQVLGSYFAAEAGGVTVVARVREDALLYVYPDGRVSEGRQGIADGFTVGEVFAWRGEVFALANALEDQPARVYKLGAGEVWSEHARGPEGTTYAQLLSQQGGRVLLSMGTFRTGVAHELTEDGVSALRWVWDLRPQVVAMTPTRTFARLPDKRCVMIAADGAPLDAPLGSCEGSAPRVRGEAMSIVRIAQAPPSALEIWWMSPGEAAPTLRATLPAPMWQPPHYIGAMTDDAVYFVWWTPEQGEELWVWDERGGARAVADLWPGAVDSRPTGLQVIGGALYFTATSPDGRGVWRIGATGQAPQLLHAPVPGVSPSEVLYMQPDGRLLFSAHSPEYGEELWALEP